MLRGVFLCPPTAGPVSARRYGVMNITEAITAVWLIGSAGLLVTVVAAGVIKARTLRRRARNAAQPQSFSPVEIIIPVKGRFPDQEITLGSYCRQNHPHFRVTFVVESADDPAMAVLNKLESRFEHVRVLVADPCDTCARKNANLVFGLKNLDPAVRIVVFCDSTNRADENWLNGFTRPIELGETEAVTTFRTFKPIPETVAGVCQAIYAAYVLVLCSLAPRPWGGGTAILRDTLQRLNIADVWRATVIDDLTLGNRLEQAGLKIRFDPEHLLVSPVYHQTVSNFLSYLDRQILFPKFTNPDIWLTTLIIHFNTTAVFIVALIAGAVLLPLGYTSSTVGIAALVSLGLTAVMALILQIVNPHGISVLRWIAAMPVLIMLSAFIFGRSIIRNYIDWHGNRYRVGKDGIVRGVKTLT